jgi:hypothetical protein
MSTLPQDLRYGLRVMVQNPGFAAVAVLTLALGIGANAAIFSLVNAIMLRPLPYPNPEQLVGLGQWRNQQGEGYIQTGVSAPNVADIIKTGVFQHVAYYRWAGLNITEGDRPESVDGIKASAEVLPMFGVQPLTGRFLLPEETEPGRDQVAVIGYRLWQMRYGSDPAILGKTISLNQRRYSIVGVMPASFRFTWDQEIDQAIFYRDLIQKIENIPGVKAAGAEGGGSNVFFQPQGQPVAAPGHEPTASYKIVTPDFLQAMGTHLVLGREFTDRDNEGATPVALISETVARRYWPHSSPLGSHLTVLARVYSGENSGSSQPLEIIGVVKDVRNDDLWRPEAAVYVPFAQKPVSSVFLVVRTAVPPMSVVPAVRNAVLSLDKEQPVNRIQTMNDIVSETYGAIRFPMTLLWIFSALALVLSAVGIFGVMSYTVNRRAKEMAIRMALGASRREMLSLVLREGLAVTLFGVVLGSAGALVLSRVMAGYL